MSDFYFGTDLFSELDRLQRQLSSTFGGFPSSLRSRPILRPSRAELRAPFFSRSFTVSDDFDTSRIDAILKDGVLKLSIPRREEAQPRKIEVRVA